MTLVLRPATPGVDGPLLLEALQTHLGPPANHDRFNWLYVGGFFGPARAWVLTDEPGGQFAGAAALFPRLFVERGKMIPGFVLGDFCLAPAFRSLGPGLQLQRACLRELSNSSAVAAYDFPSPGMEAIYRRLGDQARGNLVRLAKPLRVDSKMHRQVGFRLGALILSSIGNKFLQWKDRPLRPDNDVEVLLHRGEIGQEFSSLALRLSEQPGLCVFRSASYLRWRFMEHPYRKYEILVARRGGELAGYFVLTCDDEQLYIADLLSTGQPEVLGALAHAAAKLGRESGKETLSISLLREHSWTNTFCELGFHERESRPAVLWTAHGSRDQEWFLTDGDRES
jgi:hypothetical protein